jgi:hypothetical protein
MNSDLQEPGRVYCGFRRIDDVAGSTVLYFVYCTSVYQVLYRRLQFASHPLATKMSFE